MSLMELHQFRHGVVTHLFDNVSKLQNSAESKKFNMNTVKISQLSMPYVGGLFSSSKGVLRMNKQGELTMVICDSMLAEALDCTFPFGNINEKGYWEVKETVWVMATLNWIAPYLMCDIKQKQYQFLKNRPTAEERRDGYQKFAAITYGGISL